MDYVSKLSVGANLKASEPPVRLNTDPPLLRGLFGLLERLRGDDGDYLKPPPEFAV